MNPRKYTNVHVIDEFYCSSSGDYFAKVFWNENGQKPRVTKTFHVNAGVFLGTGRAMFWDAPAYLIKEVYGGLWWAVKTGDYQVYEYDREGNERREELRYHEPERFRALVESGCG
jgi:hypothetical protein